MPFYFRHVDSEQNHVRCIHNVVEENVTKVGVTIRRTYKLRVSFTCSNTLDLNPENIILFFLLLEISQSVISIIEGGYPIIAPRKYFEKYM